jgi:siroheme synthase
VGTLATIGSLAREADLPAPALLIVGEVVGRRVESRERTEAAEATISAERSAAG